MIRVIYNRNGFSLVATTKRDKERLNIFMTTTAQKFVQSSGQSDIQGVVRVDFVLVPKKIGEPVIFKQK